MCLINKHICNSNNINNNSTLLLKQPQDNPDCYMQQPSQKKVVVIFKLVYKQP